MSSPANARSRPAKNGSRPRFFTTRGVLAKNFTSAYIAGLKGTNCPGKAAMVPKRDEIHGPRPAASEAGRVLGVGLQFAGAIVLFLFVGRWLDSRLGTEPWLLLGGVLLGAVAGFISLYRQLAAPPRTKQDGKGQERR